MATKSTPPADVSLPRANPLQKRRVEWMGEQLRTALQADIVRGYWGNLQRLMARVLERPFEPTPETARYITIARRCLGPEAEAPAAALDALLCVLTGVAPALVAFWGPHARNWIRDITRLSLTGEWPTEPPRTGQLLPGHPVTRSGDGDYHGLEQATRRQRMELSSYLDSMDAPKRRGRPPTRHRKPPSAPRSRIDAQLADRALQLRREGEGWPAIARALKLPYDRHDPKAREAMRGRIRRLIEHAAVAEQKKSGRG